MRRLTAIIVLALAALGAAPASSHPDFGEVVIRNHAYTPARELVNQGVENLWFWDGPDTKHTVTSVPGQAEQFDSDPGKAAEQVEHKVGDTFIHRFTKPGTYTYFCKVEPEMRGEIVVVSTQADDTTSPRISALEGTPRRPCSTKSEACSKAGTRFSFRLSEESSVFARIVRDLPGGDSQKVESFSTAGRQGINRLGTRGRHLRPGRYSLILYARDAGGNRSTARSLRFRVRA